MSNCISASQAIQAADEIIRIAGLVKVYSAKLNDEQLVTDESPAINAAMKQEKHLREAADETVIVAAFREIAQIATASGEGVVPDSEIVKMEPVPEATKIVKTGEGSSATESWATFERVPVSEAPKDGTTEIISPAQPATSASAPATEATASAAEIPAAPLPTVVEEAPAQPA